MNNKTPPRRPIILHLLQKFLIIAIFFTIFITSAAYSIFGVWLPDIFGSFQILSSKHDDYGRRFYVVQYWNNVDFYNLEIIMVSKNGNKYIHYIDSDSNKKWKSDLIVNTDGKSISVDGIYYDLDLFSTCDSETYSLGCQHIYQNQY